MQKEKPTGKSKKNRSTGRRATSLTLFFSGFNLVVSSIVLYVAPPTHVAFFSDWCLLGMSKEQWNAMHVVNGLLFVTSMLIHTVYNWRALLRYLSDSTKKIVVFNKALIIALVLNITICVCAMSFLPPARQIMHLGHEINQGHLRNYRVFPYGNTKLYTLKKVAPYLGLDLDKLMSMLSDCGVKADYGEQSLNELAKTNGTSSRSVLDLLLGAMQNQDAEHLHDPIETGSPVIDIKPYVKAFHSRTRSPEWRQIQAEKFCPGRD